MSTEKKNIRPEKQAMYAEVEANVSGALYMLLADYKGMSMPETTELKKQLRGVDAKMTVVKNRMLGIICEEIGGSLTGPTALISGAGDVVEVAKSSKSFPQKRKNP